MAQNTGTIPGKRKNASGEISSTKGRGVTTTQGRTQNLKNSGNDEPVWLKLIPADEWAVYCSALASVRASGVRFLIGGGFGLAVYTKHWRRTKDMDFYVLPHERHALIAALEKEGFSDLYDKLSYDRGWIHRSMREGVIVDTIWSMANRRAEVDEQWFDHATQVNLRGEALQIIPAEELLWCKTYILQRDRSDWPDIFNLLYAVGPSLKWDHLLARFESDVPLLKALLTVFDWVCPNRAAWFPSELREQLQLPQPSLITEEEQKQRVKLLDRRAWFAAFLPEDRVLEV